MSTVMVAAVLVGGAGLGLLLLERVIRRSDVGLALALAAVSLGVLHVPAELAIGSIRITDIDVAFAVLLIAAVARLTRVSALTPLQWMLLALLGLVGWSTVAGIGEVGVGAAVNEARTFVRFLGAVLYFSTVRGDDVTDRLVVAWAAFAAFLLALTFARWAGLSAGASGAWWMGGADDLRVIDSFRTLAVLEMLLIAWAADRPAPRWVIASAPVLLATVVLLQHRTLWIALAVAALVVGVRRRRIARRLIPAAVVSIVVGSMLAFTVFGGPASIREDLETSATNADTFGWRVEGWRQLVFETGPDEPAEVAVGLPFGSGFDRRIEGQLITVSPHNFFIETYLRTGIAGAALLVLVYVVTMRSLLSVRVTRRYLHADVLLAILVAQLVYLQTSHPSPDQGLFLGLAVATAARVPRAGRPGQDARTPAVPPGTRSVRGRTRTRPLAGARP